MSLGSSPSDHTRILLGRPIWFLRIDFLRTNTHTTVIFSIIFPENVQSCSGNNNNNTMLSGSPQSGIEQKYPISEFCETFIVMCIII